MIQYCDSELTAGGSNTESGSVSGILSVGILLAFLLALTPSSARFLIQKRACRIFQEKWTILYLFTEVNEKPVCLVCMQQVSMLNLIFSATMRLEKYNSLHGELRILKMNELLLGMRKQQSVFNQSSEVSDAAVKTSYLFASKIALASKLYSEGECVKSWLQKSCVLRSDKLLPTLASRGRLWQTGFQNYRQIWTTNWNAKWSYLWHFLL